jgi:hypothetical protein
MRVLDTYADAYPTNPQVTEACDHAAHLGTITHWSRVRLGDAWAVRVTYVPHQNEDDAFESAQDRVHRVHEQRDWEDVS